MKSKAQAGTPPPNGRQVLPIHGKCPKVSPSVGRKRRRLEPSGHRDVASRRRAGQGNFRQLGPPGKAPTHASPQLTELSPLIFSPTERALPTPTLSRRSAARPLLESVRFLHSSAVVSGPLHPGALGQAQPAQSPLRLAGALPSR